MIVETASDGLQTRSTEPMYAVRHFAQLDHDVMRSYVADHPFAALVTNTSDGPNVEHLPMELDADSGSEGRLLGHVARSNPLWRAFESGPALAIFSAHDTYVSPDWYASKAADPRVVPTWNYAAVHVAGTLRFFHDADRIRALLARLTNHHEAGRATPWSISDAPAEFIDQLAGAVVGVELEIERMIGKWKLSQNRATEDRAGVIAGLRREAGPGALRVADLMEAQMDDD
jgi:transcriptional regulator